MANIDIDTADPTSPINNNYITCSALPTGSYSRLLVKKNYPKDLTFDNIASKFGDRFDDPSYYYGNTSFDGGDVGSVLGI